MRKGFEGVRYLKGIISSGAASELGQSGAGPVQHFATMEDKLSTTGAGLLPIL